jgi:pyridoxal phosphate enzyme (YggS family)
VSRVAANLEIVRSKIADACAASDRDPDAVTLIAVSKTVSRQEIMAAYDAGQRHFGESRLQEAVTKMEGLPSDIVWHFIGPLQSNKAKKVSSLFDVIHSFDNEHQVREAAKAVNPAAGLIQVNIGREAQKSGVAPEEPAIAALVETLAEARIEFKGLMAIGPDLGASKMRDFFTLLRNLATPFSSTWLCMGMSGDFEVAIEEGATHVRVGSAIFGPR